MNTKVVSSAEVAAAANKNDSFRKNRDALRSAVKSFDSLIERVRKHFETCDIPKKWSDRFVSFVSDGTSLTLYRVNESGKQTLTAEGQAFRRAFLAAFPPEENKTEPKSAITLALAALRRAAKSGEKPTSDEALEILTIANTLSDLVQE